MLSLALSTIRGRVGGFVGAFIAVLCGSAVITACGILLESGLSSGIAPERYATASVVVGANQAHPVDEDVDVRFGERVPLPADRVDDVARVPGVASVVPDRSFVVSVVTKDRGVIDRADGFPTLGHGWSSAVLGPFTLSSGRAPAGPSEVVLDTDLAARAEVGVGGQVDLAVGSTPSPYRVVGIASPPGDGLRRQSAVFFADGETRLVSGKTDRVDTLAVFAHPDVDPDQLADRIAAAVPELVTYTGRDRGDAEFLDSGQTRSLLITMAAAFGGSMAMVVMFVVASTLALTIQQRRRELALVRAIAATPRQVHAMIGAETVLVSSAGAVLGVLPGIAVSFLLREAFVEVGVMPADFDLTVGVLPMVAAVLLCVGVSRLAGVIVTARWARLRPVEALGEAAVEPPELGRVRLTIGWVLVLLSVAAAVVVPLVVPGQAAVAGAGGSALLLIVAVALLGPRLLTSAVGLFGGLLCRRGAVSGFLAMANATANSRRLSSATTPLIMGVALTAVQIFTMTTVGAAAREQALAGVVADYVITGGPSGMSPEVASVLREVDGVSTVTPVARTQTLVSFREAGEERVESFPSQGVTPERLDDTMRLDVRDGRLDDLRGETVALSRMAAGTIGVGIGETVDMRLGDGTAIRPKVVAVYGNGLGFGDVTLPHEWVVEHTTNRLDAAVLVKLTQGGDSAALGTALRRAVEPYPTITVADRETFAVARNSRLAGESMTNLILNAVLLGYIAIAVVNTLVMATGARVREFALLQLVGTSRRQVRAMMRGEARIVVAMAVVFGTLVAIPPLVGVSLGMTESPIPTISWPAYAGMAMVAVLLGWGSIMIPARMAMRSRPVDSIGVRE